MKSSSNVVRRVKIEVVAGKTPPIRRSNAFIVPSRGILLGSFSELTPAGSGRDDDITGGAWDAVGKDRHQSRAGRKASYRERAKACVRPAPEGIGLEEN